MIERIKDLATALMESQATFARLEKEDLQDKIKELEARR